MSFHPEVLIPPMEEVLSSLGPTLTNRGFHLAGGTAVALYLGHRKSVDLDWFTHGGFDDPQGFAGSLQEMGVELQVEQVSRATLHGRIQGVRISLLDFPYRLLRTPSVWRSHGCSLLSLDDLGCMKLSAITQRGARKDFVDLFALGKAHRPLAELLDLYQEKFDTTETAHVLYGLSYFDDAEADPMPEMLWPTEWDEVKRTVLQWLRDVSTPGTADTP